MDALTYDLSSDDELLIAAAIELGEWLGCQLEVTERQQEAIRQVLFYLRALPASAPSDVVADFGFMLVLDDPKWAGAHCGSWCVSFARGSFEIFSCGNEELGECCWEVWPGRSPFREVHDFAQWIEQVRDPRRLSASGCRFVIQASAIRVSL